MPNHRISPDLKECALCLWEIGWSIEDICFVLGVSRSSLYRWRAIFDDLGTVTRPPSPLRGPTQILTHALLTACQDLFAQDSDLYIDEVITWLALVHNIEISPTTLRHNLEEAGLTRKILHKLMAERDEQCHGDWKDLIVQEFLPDGSQLVFCGRNKQK